MTYAIAVSKQGINVGTATDPNDFIFHSSYNTFKILNQGNISAVATAGSTSFITQSHGQGAAPFVFSFIKWPDGLVGMPHTIYKGYGGSVSNLSYSVDNSNMNWSFLNNLGTNVNVNISYYICEAPATAGTP